MTAQDNVNEKMLEACKIFADRIEQLEAQVAVLTDAALLHDHLKEGEYLTRHGYQLITPSPFAIDTNVNRHADRPAFYTDASGIVRRSDAEAQLRG